MLLQSLYVFLGFANFYQHFIQNFSKIALLTSIFKITKSFYWAPRVFKADNNEVINSDSRADKIVENLSKSKKLKNIIKLSEPKVRRLKQPTFLSSKTSKVLSMKDVFKKYFLATVET